jgi:hypothetical protein
MSLATINLEKKPRYYKKHRRDNPFPWLGVFLVLTALGLMFYVIGPNDINKMDMPKTSASFIGESYKK